MINKTYAVFGLGRYGMAVAKELSESGAEVLAVDRNEELVNDAAAVLPLCKCADVTDEEVIRQLGISNIDTVIIAMAESFEAEIMAVTLCKDVGVPTVIAKCSNETRANILLRVGADQIVLPEVESGSRLAKNLISSGFAGMVELSDEISIVEFDVKPQWEGKTLLDLNLRRKYAVNVIAIRKDGQVTVDVDPEEQLTEHMKLIVIANAKSLARLG